MLGRWRAGLASRRDQTASNHSPRVATAMRSCVGSLRHATAPLVSWCCRAQERERASELESGRGVEVLLRHRDAVARVFSGDWPAVVVETHRLEPTTRNRSQGVQHMNSEQTRVRLSAKSSSKVRSEQLG